MDGWAGQYQPTEQIFVLHWQRVYQLHEAIPRIICCPSSFSSGYDIDRASALYI